MAISILIATKIDAMLYRPRSNSPVNCVMANFSSVLRCSSSAIPNKSQNKSLRLPPMLKGSNCQSKLVLHDLNWLVPVSNHLLKKYFLSLSSGFPIEASRADSLFINLATYDVLNLILRLKYIQHHEEPSR